MGVGVIAIVVVIFTDCSSGSGVIAVVCRGSKSW